MRDDEDDIVVRSGDVSTGPALPGASPLTATAPLLLRTHELSWEALEHLVVALAVRKDHAKEARPFGRGGQAQNGVDVVAFFSSSAAAVYQAKKYKRFTAADLRKAVLAYADGNRPFDAQRLVIVTTADTRDTKVDLELARLREQYPDLVIDLWGRLQLSDMLFTAPDLVRRFFGEHTMQVFCRPLPVQEGQADGGNAADRLELEDYSTHLSPYLCGDLHELVPLTLQEVDSREQVSTAELAAWLRPGRHVHVVGASGAGKSHTLMHAAIGLIQRGWLTILLRAGVYEGRLEDSLDECVAPFSQRAAQSLVEAAQLQQMPIVLLVDAVNECPVRLQERLVQQLGSWCRRVGATVVLSSQEFIRVPAILMGARLRTADPDPQQRAALLRSHGSERDGLGEDDCAAFATAFELSLAARLVQRLPLRASRAALLEAYVGEQLQFTSQPTIARQVLHHWAMLMDERLTGWLPLAEARRSAVQLLAAQGVAASTVDEALQSPVVRAQHHKVEFRHEWYTQLLIAEALMWRCSSVSELASELGRPHHRELVVWAVSLHSDPEAICGLLRELPDTEAFTEALRGRLGLVADEVMLAEARRCLESAAEAVAASRVVCTTNTYTVEPYRPWSSYEQAVFAAAGTTARDGRLLDPLARLLRETDQAFARGATSVQGRSQHSVSDVIAAALNGPTPIGGGVRLPAAVIADAARLAWPPFAETSRHPAAEAPVLQRWIASLGENDVGLTLLLCYVLQWTDDPAAAALAPALFTRAWASGASQLRFAGFDLLSAIRTIADEVITAQITELLHQLRTDNVFVSTMLVETLHHYGQITSPYAVDDIAEEITLLLTDPGQSDACVRAQRILESQFEDVVAAPFVEAIDALEPDAYRALLILAVREGDATLFTDSFLNRLVRGQHPDALPALRHWASHLPAPYPFWRSAVSCHLLGIEGCAFHLPDPPPLLTGHKGNDAEAWRCYGRILFWLHRPDLEPSERTSRCAPVWEQLTGPLLNAAVDPLHQFQYVARFAQDARTSALGRLVDTFPAQVRVILHHGLKALDHLTALPPHALTDDRTATVLRLLAHVGDRTSLPLLTAYRNHPELGSAAAETIRHINNHTSMTG
ncbi:hypothetical protein [Streptomyces chartreusis]